VLDTNPVGARTPRVLSRFTFGIGCVAVIVATTGAVANCWYLLDHNCCALITGPNQTRKCGLNTPCPDLITTNSIYSKAYEGSGRTGLTSGPPSAGCVWTVRYCNQAQQCKTAGDVSADCYSEYLDGPACVGGGSTK